LNALLAPGLFSKAGRYLRARPVKSAEELRDVAPWIVKPKKGNRFARGLFTHDQALFGLRGQTTGIYLPAVLITAPCATSCARPPSSSSAATGSISGSACGMSKWCWLVARQARSAC
jgi:hypothetical protein